MAKSNSTKLTIMAENSRKDALLTERGINHDPLLRRTANNAAHRRQGEEYDRLLGAGEEGEENNDQPAPPAAAPEENQAEEFFLTDLSDKEEEPTGEPSPQPDEDDKDDDEDMEDNGDEAENDEDDKDGDETKSKSKDEEPAPQKTKTEEEDQPASPDNGPPRRRKTTSRAIVHVPRLRFFLETGDKAQACARGVEYGIHYNIENLNDVPRNEDEARALHEEDPDSLKAILDVLEVLSAVLLQIPFLDEIYHLIDVILAAKADDTVKDIINDLPEKLQLAASSLERRSRHVVAKTFQKELPRDTLLAVMRKHEQRKEIRRQERLVSIKRQAAQRRSGPPPVARSRESSPALIQPATVAAAALVKAKVKDDQDTDRPSAKDIVIGVRRDPIPASPPAPRNETSPPAPAPEKPRKDKDSDQPQPQPYRYRAGQPPRHPNHDLINRAKGGLAWLAEDHPLRQKKYELSRMERSALSELVLEIDNVLAGLYRQGYVPQTDLKDVNNQLEAVKSDLTQVNERATQAEEKVRKAEEALATAKQEIPDNYDLLLEGEPGDDQLGQVVEELIPDRKEVQELREQVKILEGVVTKQQADQAELRKQLARHETSAGPDDVICQLRENHDHELVPRATHVHHWWKWLGLASCATALFTTISLAVLIGIMSLSPPASSTAVQPEKSPSKTSSGLDLNFPALLELDPNRQR